MRKLKQFLKTVFLIEIAQGMALTFLTMFKPRVLALYLAICILGPLAMAFLLRALPITL